MSNEVKIGELSWVLKAVDDKLKASVAESRRIIGGLRQSAKKDFEDVKKASGEAVDKEAVKKAAEESRKSVKGLRDSARKDLDEIKAASGKAIDTPRIKAAVEGAKKDVRRLAEEWKKAGENIRRNFNASMDAVEKHNQQKSVKMARDIANGFQRAGAAMTVGLTVPLVAAGKTAIDTAVHFDGLKASLISVTGSALIAEGQWSKLLLLSKKPGIEFEGAVIAARNLQAMGISFKEATRLIEGFGNATVRVGGTADDFRESIRQWSQMLSSGKVQADELRIIMERLPDVGAVIKGKFGTFNSEAIQKQIEAGKLSIEEFNRTVVDGLRDLRTPLPGVREDLKNVRLEVTLMWQELGHELMPVFKQTISVVRDMARWFGNLDGGTQKLIVTAGILSAAIGPATGLVGTLWKAGSAVKTFIEFLRTWKAAADAAAASQAVLNAAAAAGGTAATSGAAAGGGWLTRTVGLGVMRVAGPLALLAAPSMTGGSIIDPATGKRIAPGDTVEGRYAGSLAAMDPEQRYEAIRQAYFTAGPKQPFEQNVLDRAREIPYVRDLIKEVGALNKEMAKANARSDSLSQQQQSDSVQKMILDAQREIFGRTNPGKAAMLEWELKNNPDKFAGASQKQLNELRAAARKEDQLDAIGAKQAKAIKDASRAITDKLILEMVNTVKLPSTEASCAYFASQIIEKVTGVDIPGANGIGGAKALVDHVRKAGGQDIADPTKAPIGSLIYFRGPGYGKQKFNEGGSMVGYHVGVSIGNGQYIDASGDGGRDRKGKPRRIGRDARALTLPWAVKGTTGSGGVLTLTDQELEQLQSEVESAVQARLLEAAKTEAEKFIVRFGPRERRTDKAWLDAWDHGYAESMARDRLAAEEQAKKDEEENTKNLWDQFNSSLEESTENVKRQAQEWQERERGFNEMMADLRRANAIGANASRVANFDYDMKNTPWKFEGYTKEQLDEWRGALKDQDDADEAEKRGQEWFERRTETMRKVREEQRQAQDRDARYLDVVRDYEREMNTLLGLSDELYQKQELIKQGFLAWQAEAIVAARKEVEQFRKTQDELMGLAERGSRILVSGFEEALEGKNPFDSLLSSFRQTINQMIAEWLAMQAKMLIFKMIGGLGGGGGAGSSNPWSAMTNALGLPGRASGGPVTKDNAYWVGELGPELFVPSRSGHIVNSAQSRQGSGAEAPVTNITVKMVLNNVQNPAAFAANSDQIAGELGRQISRVTKRNGGRR